MAGIRAKLDAYNDPPSLLLALECQKLDNHFSIKDEKISIRINFHKDYF